MAKEFLLHSPEDMLAVASCVCDHFEGDSKPLKIKITEAGKRSLSQNALMWKWLTEISEQLKSRIGQDHDAETIHEYMKLQFCPCQEVNMGSNSKPISIRSTKRLDKGEMCHYLNKVEQWAIERGFRLTIPQDCEYMNLMEMQNQ